MMKAAFYPESIHTSGQYLTSEEKVIEPSMESKP
jgi:hypothetical protein